MRATGHRSGFVLMEIIVALSVFSLVVVGIVSALHSASSLVALVNRERWVQQQQELLLAEVLKLPTSRQDFLNPKTITLQEFGAEGTINAEEVTVYNEEGKTLPQMYDVSIKIRWLEGSERRESTLKTRHYFPLYQGR